MRCSAFAPWVGSLAEVGTKRESHRLEHSLSSASRSVFMDGLSGTLTVIHAASELIAAETSPTDWMS